MSRLIFAVAVILCVGTHDAVAQQAVPELIGKYRDWTAYKVTDRGAKECYMVSEPTDSQPEGVNRGTIHAFVSHRPAQKVDGEFNIQIGYPFKPNSLGSLSIGGDRKSVV